jgi:hypothetical protein
VEARFEEVRPAAFFVDASLTEAPDAITPSNIVFTALFPMTSRISAFDIMMSNYFNVFAIHWIIQS